MTGFRQKSSCHDNQVTAITDRFLWSHRVRYNLVLNATGINESVKCFALSHLKKSFKAHACKKGVKNRYIIML